MPSPHPFPVQEPGFTWDYVRESGSGTRQFGCPLRGGSGRRESEGACGSDTKCLSHQRTRRDSEKHSTCTSTPSRVTASADSIPTRLTMLPRTCSWWRGGRSTRCPTEIRHCRGSTASLATRFGHRGGPCDDRRPFGRRSTGNPAIRNPDLRLLLFTTLSRRNWSVPSPHLDRTIRRSSASALTRAFPSDRSPLFSAALPKQPRSDVPVR